MTDVRNLLKRVAAEEEALRSRLFLAPCVRGGRVRTRVSGLVYSFAVIPREFEGWGIFRPQSEREAELVEEAGLERVSEYLRPFRSARFRLCYRLRGGAWLALPVNESQAKDAAHFVLHLVRDGHEFEQVLARSVGGVWWFEEVDRRASPLEAESLREALRNSAAPDELRWKGLTPEMRACYRLARGREELSRERRRGRMKADVRGSDESRLREALRFGGGELRSFHDRGDFWLVEWLTRDRMLHTSAIAKHDLTVMSAGICLDGEDAKFDLQSLVGVVEDER
ncbi:MAG TPA: hypothetical protein VJS44_23000 [Pyrinomonadaceae bacterium]|nr:hypothetical protein [Pyrinomonadaceae bacterium]